MLQNARVNASVEKKRLRDQQRELISKFATKEVAEDLLTSGFSLGGKYVDASARRRCSATSRSFTTIAEARDPAETTELLNDYYTLMMDAIMGEGGIVNQMVGMIGLFNDEQTARGRVGIRIGIGVASGQVIAWYTGTQHRATYTCVGDTVNVAARLESHTKVLDCPILIDAASLRSPGRSTAAATTLTGTATHPSASASCAPRR